MGQPQNRGGPAHVLFHHQHPACRLDIQPAGVKTHALAHQRQFRTRCAPVQVDQPWCGGRRAPDRVDQWKVLCQQIVADDGHLMVAPWALGQYLGGMRQIVRTHVRCWRVDQIAGQTFCPRQDFDARPVDPLGYDQLSVFAGLGLVTVKAIARQQPAQTFGFRHIRRQAGCDSIGAGRQVHRAMRQWKMHPRAFGRGAIAGDGHPHLSIVGGNQQRLAEIGRKAVSGDPGCDGRLLVLQPLLQCSGFDDVQRNRVCIGVGKTGGHRSLSGQGNWAAA